MFFSGKRNIPSPNSVLSKIFGRVSKKDIFRPKKPLKKKTRSQNQSLQPPPIETKSFHKVWNPPSTPSTNLPPLRRDWQSIAEDLCLGLTEKVLAQKGPVGKDFLMRACLSHQRPPDHHKGGINTPLHMACWNGTLKKLVDEHLLHNEIFTCQELEQLTDENGHSVLKKADEYGELKQFLAILPEEERPSIVNLAEKINFIDSDDIMANTMISFERSGVFDAKTLEEFEKTAPEEWLTPHYKNILQKERQKLKKNTEDFLGDFFRDLEKKDTD